MTNRLLDIITEHDNTIIDMAKKRHGPSKDEIIAQLGGALSLTTRALDQIYSGAQAAKEWHRSPRRKMIAKALADAGIKDPSDYS